MNFKAIILSTLVLTTASAQAGFLTPIHNYILKSGKVVLLQGIKESRGTAWYFDNDLNKRVKVDLTEVSKETKNKVNGVGADDYVYTTTNKGPQICLTYHVFENGMSQMGCRTGKILDYYGPQKYEVAAYSGSTKNVLPSLSEMNGFSKNEIVMLNGRKVQIKGIYSNGYVLTETVFILSKYDNTKSISNASIEIVTTNDLDKL